MKKVLLLMIIAPMFAFHCKKEGYELEGKIVRISCASFVVQVLNDKSIGEDGWKDMFDNDKEYNDVITASNKCKIPSDIKPGETIRFKIKSPSKNDCMLCTLYDAPPKVMYEIILRK
jgi:hypothetical protein